jgi:large subunit ribosomal protein L10e
MATLRKANAYSKRKVVPYTRVSRRKGKSYIKAVPHKKVVKYNMGKESLFNSGKLAHCLTLVADEKVQIRQNAFEACRQFVNKKLDKELSGQYFFKVVPFAHHIQRENRMLTGAGADRMSTGMQLSYGKAMNKAAILKKCGKIFFVAVGTPKAVAFVRKTFKQIKSKLPCKTKILYELKPKVCLTE